MKDVVDNADLADLGFAPRPVSPAEHAAFVSKGHVQLGRLWTTAFGDALRDEALSRWPLAELPDGGPRTPVAESRVPRRQTPVATGPLLTALHFSMVSHVRALSARMLVPTFAAFGYYEVDDEVLLHVDTDDCEMTLLTTALGRVGPLRLHPDLTGVTLEELGRLEGDAAWDHETGIPVGYPDLGLMALSGHTIPHHRPSREITGVNAVAALCYRSLF